LLEYLFDRERYKTLDHGAVAVLCDVLAERGVVSAARFRLVNIERFECQSAHVIAIYHHSATGLDFSLVPGGRFLMGPPRDERGRKAHETQHQVTLTRPLLVSRTACTQAAWKKVSGGENPSHWVGETLPVEQVSRDAASGWCDTVGLSLLTEAQWEYSCRSGTTTRFCGGNAESDLDAHGWYSTNAADRTHPVAQKRPNSFGLFDMHANVWEWCSDWYADDEHGPDLDPAGPESGVNRVIRGGCWGAGPEYCCVSSRGGWAPGSSSHSLGFRPSFQLATNAVFS
jgi:formylglycine-generating enzyme required for sulfatase activity